jgi:hypothetical protein
MKTEVINLIKEIDRKLTKLQNIECTQFELDNIDWKLADELQENFRVLINEEGEE